MARVPFFEKDLNIIAKMGDYPGADDGLTTEQLKARFDEAGISLKDFLNDFVIPAINAITGEGGQVADFDLGGYRLVRVGTPQEETDGANKGYVDGGVVHYKDVFVPASAFHMDIKEQLTDYPYMAEIPLPGVTAGQLPMVLYNENDDLSNFSRSAESYDGGVKIWAASAPTEAMTIPAIVMLRLGAAKEAET